MQQINSLLVPVKLIIFLASFLVLAVPSIATNVSYSLVFDIGATRYRDSGEFYKGEPICIRAGIRRQNQSEATEKDLIQIGVKDNPWYKNITFSVYSIQKTEGQSISGSNENIAVASTKKLSDVHLEQIKNQTEKRVLKANEIARSFWAISPDVTSKLPAGRYSIQARFDTTEIAKTCPQIVYTNISSSEVSIVLNEPPTDNAGKAEVVEAKARYSELQGNYNEVITLLEQVERLSPSMQEIHCRLGRAYELQGDVKNAIKEYRIYVEWAKKQPATGKGGSRDHADAIESTIKALEARLSKEK